LATASSLPKAPCRGFYKAYPEDFVVSEELPFQPEGSGEHVYLRIRKRGHNTAQVQQQLARLAAIPRHGVGYAGLKDRQAVTSQWFSVHLPGGGDPDWSQLEQDDIAVEAVDRHPRKLRPGVHRGNHFSIVLREIECEPGILDERLEAICAGGFANYFGEQRFGRGGSNLIAAAELGPVRKGRLSQRQALALSAARGYLFNCVLAERESRGTWNKVLVGELVNLDGSRSFFGPVDNPGPLQERLVNLEIHPTGPMVGSEPAGVDAEVQALEASIIGAHPEALGVVHRLQARSARRPLRARARGLGWRWIDRATLQLDVSLDRGVYATSLLRSLGDFRQSGNPR
jgi:tRNA pseudouridine13 synthase